MNNISNKFSQILSIDKVRSFKTKMFNFLQRNPIKDVFISNKIDIHSKGKFPSNVLSNFHESHFVFEDVQINSMEGFLQSLKTSDKNLQKLICKLIGKDAKLAGNELLHMYDKKNIFWNGRKIDRHSETYQELLKQVYKAKFDQDPLFRKAIQESKDKTLIHSIGKHSKDETILTEEEFVSVLNWLRQFSY